MERTVADSGGTPRSRRMGFFARLGKYIMEGWGGDIRSAALFRFMMAVTVMGDLIDRAWDLRAHYTDDGVLPRSVAMEHYTHYTWMSLHFISGRFDAVILIWLLHMAAAVCMMIGFRSRWSAALVVFMHNSMHARNILILHGGDVLLRLLLLWAVFLPLGETWSVDAALARLAARQASSESQLTSKSHLEKPLLPVSSGGSFRDFTRLDGALRGLLSAGFGSPYAYLNLGIVLLMLQFPLMYVTSVFWKVGPEWTVTYHATYYALELDYFRTPVGELFRMLPQWVLQIMTFAVWQWEKWCSLFLISPLWTGPARTFGCFSIVGLHLGLCLCLRLNSFFWTPVSGILGVLPTWFWEVPVRRYGLRAEKRLHVHVAYNPAHVWTGLFSALFCEFLLTRESTMAALALPSEAAGSHGAALVVTASDRRSGADVAGVLLMCEASPFLVYFVPLYRRILTLRRNLIPVKASGRVSQLMVVSQRMLAALFAAPDQDIDAYVLKANARVREEAPELRYQTHGRGKLADNGRKLAHEMADRFWQLVAFGVQVLLQLFALLLFVLGMLWCLSMLGVSWASISGNKEKLVFMFHTDQNWNMFSPRPPDFNWWYVIEGTTANGTKLELWKDEGMFYWKGNPEITFDPPKHPFYAPIRNHRWIKWYESVNNNGKSDVVRLYFGRYICREWNRRHPVVETKLYTFRLWWVYAYNRLDGTRSEYIKQNLWDHQCYAKNPLQTNS